MLSIWNNRCLSKQFDDMLTVTEIEDRLLDITTCFIFNAVEQGLGSLIVRGRAINKYNSITVYTTIEFNLPSLPYLTQYKVDQAISAIDEQLQQGSATLETYDIPVKSIIDIMPYPDNPSLVSLPLHSLKTVTSICWAFYRGKDGLLVEVDSVMIQAGANLESNLVSIPTCELRPRKQYDQLGKRWPYYVL